MGWFTKEEVYDKKKGKFVPKQPRSKPLTREEQFGSRGKPVSRRALEKQKFRAEYEKARQKGLTARARSEGFRAGRTSPLDKLSRMIGSPPPAPRRRTSKKHKSPSMGTVRKRRKPPSMFGPSGFDVV